MPSSKSNVRLKLLIDKKNRKVLFAKAGKDFVKFPYILLSLRVGRVTTLLSKNRAVGMLGNLYNCVKNLSDIYVQPNVSKDTLVKSKMPTEAGSARTSTLLSLPSRSSSLAKRFYVCGYTYCSRKHVSGDSNAVCPACENAISKEAPYVASSAVAGASQTAWLSSREEGGYVRELCYDLHGNR